jgi:hypothetical protein
MSVSIYELENKLSDEDHQRIRIATIYSNIRYYFSIWYRYKEKNTHEEIIKSFMSCLEKANGNGERPYGLLKAKCEGIAAEILLNFKIKNYELVEEWLNVYKQYSHI